MDYTTVEIKFLEQKVAALQELVEYYEGLLDYLDDMIPCIDEVIANYDETSPTCLRWKVDILTSCGKRTKAQVGKVAGGMTKKSGYYQTRLMQKTFQVHRIIYKLFYGNIPRTLNIDHLDRNKMNNKISNLRATNLNNRNLPKQNRNKSGFCGVQRTHNGWQATWKRLDGKNGTKYFSSLKYGDMQAKSLAVAARELAIIKLNAQGAGYTDIHGR